MAPNVEKPGRAAIMAAHSPMLKLLSHSRKRHGASPEALFVGPDVEYQRRDVVHEGHHLHAAGLPQVEGLDVGTARVAHVDSNRRQSLVAEGVKTGRVRLAAY